MEPWYCAGRTYAGGLSGITCSRTTALCPGLSGQTASGPMVENGVFAKIRVRARSKGWLRGAPMFNAFLRGIPVLWGLGALTPTGAAMLVKLAIERWPRGALINFVVYCWIAIAVSAACAAILNGIAIHDYAKGFGNAFGFGVVGWIFGALAIAAGAAHHLDDPKTVRATTWVGGYIIILGAIAGVAEMAGMQNLQLWPTPIGMILPESPSVSFCTVTTIFQSEETLGEATTRLLLFFPWTTGLGLGGLAITFISMLEGNLRWRLLGVLRRSDCGCVQPESHRHRLTDRNGRTLGLSSFIVSGAARCARSIARRIFYSQSGRVRPDRKD